MRIAKDWRKRS